MPSSRRPPMLPPLLPLLLAATVMVAACQLTAVVSPRTWTQTVANGSGTDSTVTVTDRSGKVTAVAFDPADAAPFGEVTSLPGRPDVLDVPWTGGSCDATTDIGIAAAGVGLAVTVKIASSGQVCDAMGVGHTLRLTLGAPVAPAAVTVTQ